MVERWRSLVGRHSAPVANLVEKGAVRRVAEAIGDPNPLYVDEAVAKRSRYGGLLAPPTFPRTFDYGRVDGLDLPESGLIHGKHRIAYVRPLLVGEEVFCHQELKGYHDRDGRRGRLGFLIFEQVGTDLEGERVFTMNDTIVVTQALREALGA